MSKATGGHGLLLRTHPATNGEHQRECRLDMWGSANLEVKAECLTHCTVSTCYNVTAPRNVQKSFKVLKSFSNYSTTVAVSHIRLSTGCTQLGGQTHTTSSRPTSLSGSGHHITTLSH